MYKYRSVTASVVKLFLKIIYIPICHQTTAERNNFDKQTVLLAHDFNRNYDYDSVMHYRKFAFSKNGKPTILVIANKNKEVGQRNDMSPEDVIKLNLLYKCQGM